MRGYKKVNKMGKVAKKGSPHKKRRKRNFQNEIIFKIIFQIDKILLH